MQNSSFSSPKIKGSVAVRKRATDLGLLENSDQPSQLLTREKREKKCCQGNRDLVLNIPVTVIEECLCVGMSCTSMRLCMWQWAAAWREKCLKTIDGPVVLCECVRAWRALDIYSIWLFCVRACPSCSDRIPCPCIAHWGRLLCLLSRLCDHTRFVCVGVYVIQSVSECSCRSCIFLFSLSLAKQQWITAKFQM